jgi:Protein of unknown function (DUF2281)
MTVKELLLQEIDTTDETVLLQTLTYIQTLKHTIPEPNLTDQPKKYRQAGSVKGIIMSPDFDAPLEDLKNYM